MLFLEVGCVMEEEITHIPIVLKGKIQNSVPMLCGHFLFLMEVPFNSQQILIKPLQYTSP